MTTTATPRQEPGPTAPAPQPPAGPFRLKEAWPWLAWAVLFAVAHTQAPLYYSNQHQYFLHGLAEGGLGFLDRDWLANTADPTPVFTAFVAVTYRYLGEWCFQLAYFLLLGLYFVSIVSLVAALPAGRLTGLARFAFLTLLVVVHAGVVRLASVRLFGVDYPWYLQSGVAGQYVLGPGLQPSAFGVLLITSLALFLHGRPFAAALCSALAAVLHATYLLPAALLTVGYLAALWREGRRRDALVVGAVSLVAVLPAVAYHALTFAPSSAVAFAEAQRILAEVRIPHHAKVRRWFDWIAFGQVMWFRAALFLVRRTRAFLVLFLPGLLAILLTVVQAVTGSHTLALLFPWRISAVLVPVATAVILARLAGAAGAWLGKRPWRQVAWGACIGLVAAVTLGGLAINPGRLAYHLNDEEVAVLEYVSTHKQPGDVYLLPIRIPALGSGKRGSVSTSFTPPPRIEKNANLIPVDFQRFRIATGAPIYVDFKSVPYQDAEVLEWYHRLLQVQEWYERLDRGEAVAGELRRAGVTHVVTRANQQPAGDGLKQVYADEAYRVYEVVGPGA